MKNQTFIADQQSGSVELPPIAAGRQMAYSMENPIYPLTDPSIFSEGLVAVSGHRVSPIKALHLPAVYQAVTRIAGDIARCPLELYVEKDGICKAMLDDPIHRLTAIQPNREMDAFKFWNRIVTQRLVWQNAYIFIAPNVKDEPAELLPLLADRTHPKRAGGKLFYITETSEGEIPIPANRIIHLEGITFDNMEAMELTKLMRDAWGLALAQMDFASRVYRTGGRKGGWLEIPLGMTKTATDKLEEGFRRKYEDPSAAFTTVILRDNAKFHEGQMTLRESQVLEGREESVRDVARAFNIRPGHLGVETTGVYGNKADDTRDYVDNTLRPHMAGIAAQCRVKLLTLDRQGSHCFGHNTDELERLSLQEEFTAYGAGVTARIITPNEARGKLGFPPLPDGDTLQNPNTQAAPLPGKDAGTPPPKKKPKAKIYG
jgi:HK97 family phage portal protein